MRSRLISCNGESQPTARSERPSPFSGRGDLIDLVVGYGPTYLAMEWLYGLELVATDSWEPTWLMEQALNAIPVAGGKPVAWSASLEQHYSSDWYEGAAHLLTVRLTDTLVRVALKETAVAGIERLFRELLKFTEPVPTLLSGLDALESRGRELAIKHLRADPAGEWNPDAAGEQLSLVSDRGEVILRSPGFTSVPSSVYVGVGNASL